MKEVTATQDQWQWVMWYLGSAQMPEKLGDRTFNSTMRTRIDAEIAEVFDALVPHSYYLQQQGKAYDALFGAKEDWTEKEPREPLHADKFYKVEMTPKATSGLLWLFTILLTPATPVIGPDGKAMIDRQSGRIMMTHPNVNPATAARFIWPIMANSGKTEQLRRAIGIDDKPAFDSFDWALPAPAKVEVAR